MIRYENECVGCPPEMGCLGSLCPNRKVPYYYCDKCKEEVDELYEVGNKDLCEDCLKDMFKKDF